MINRRTFLGALAAAPAALGLPKLALRDTRRRFEIWGQWDAEVKMWRASTILVLASGAHYYIAMWGPHTSTLHAVALGAARSCKPGDRPATQAEMASGDVFIMGPKPDSIYLHYA